MGAARGSACVVRADVYVDVDGHGITGIDVTVLGHVVGELD